jgi:geranylgeranylglycerol-phosphate geranylgeranyltransferase
MILNDFFDKDIDKKNKPHRPIPSGKIKAKYALLVSLTLFILGIGLANMINLIVLTIAILASVLLFTYAETISKIKYIGNSIVALSTGLTFILGESITGHIGSPVIIVLALLAIYSTWAREIYKDIEDMKADKNHRDTLPLKEGIVHSAAIAGMFLIISVALTPIPLFLELMPVQYLLIISSVDLAFIWIAFSAVFKKKPKTFHLYATAIKLLQFLALIGFATVIF